MAHNISVNGMKIEYMARENMYGMMAECMRVVGLITTWMDMVVTFGKMEENMKDNTKTIRNTEKASMFGLMAENTMVCGKKENSMDMVCTYLKTALVGKESGIMERDFNGSMIKSKKLKISLINFSTTQKVFRIATLKVFNMLFLLENINQN